VVDVTIWQIPGHPRSKAVCTAMLEGISKAGDTPILKSALQYTRPDGRVGVFYGLAGKLARAFAEYPAAGKTAVYVDMGYWGRKEGGRFVGYHKLAVNGRHPTPYFQAHPHDARRIERFGLKLKPWREDGRAVVLAGMGPKGSRAEGFPPQGWERWVVPILQRATGRPILYRPKPNVEGSKPIPGTTMIDKDQPLELALRDAWCLVAHHSNAAVEAIIQGVPAFVAEGVALPMASSDFSAIERPARPEGRERWLNDIGWTQWSVAEMASGEAWLHLKSEGLVP
jgi:hypothetical protein